MSREDDGAGGRHQTQQNDEVAVDSVKENEAPANDGHKLKARKKSSGEDGGKVNQNSNPVEGTLGVVITVERALRSSVAAASVEAKILQTSKSEPHEGPSEDEEQDKIVAFGESNGVVYFTGCGDEAVGRSGDSHVDVGG